MKKNRLFFLASFALVALFVSTTTPMKKIKEEKQVPKFVPGQYFTGPIKQGESKAYTGWRFTSSILPILNKNNIQPTKSHMQISDDKKMVLLIKNKIHELLEIVEGKLSQKQLQDKDKVYFVTDSKSNDCMQIMRGSGKIVWSKPVPKEESGEDNVVVSWVKEHKTVTTLATIGALVIALGLRRYLNK